MTEDNTPIPGETGPLPITNRLIRPDRCGLCKYAEKMPGADPRFECHRNPAGVTSFLAPTENGKGVTVMNSAAFPIVHDYQWCGEWVPRVLQS